MKSALLFLLFSALVSATTVPTVNVAQPANGNTFSSPVNFMATASSPQCAKGIAAMRIYTAPGVSPYTVNGGIIDTEIALSPGSYSTVVQAWDNCGGVGKTMVSITVAASSLVPAKFVYTSDLAVGKVAGYLVNSTTGALTPTGQPPVWAHWGPVRMASDKGGYRFYVVNQGSHDVNAYFIYRNNGYLVPVPGSPFPVAGTGTNLAVHPSGKYVYVTTDTSHGGESSITALAVNSDGSLKPIAGSPFGIADRAASIAIDPQGRFLYAGHFNSSDINAYSINPVDGALTPVPGEPFTVPVSEFCFLCDNGSITDMAIDASGTYLVAPVFSNGEIGVYRIDGASGTLTAVPGSPFIDSLPNSPTAAGSLTESIAIDPANNFVYADDANCNVNGCIHEELGIWRLDAATGDLQRLQFPGSPFVPDGSCNQDSVRADTLGNFVYVLAVNPCSGATAPAEIKGFAINKASGELSPVAGSPFSLGISSPPNVLPEWDAIAVVP